MAIVLPNTFSNCKTCEECCLGTVIKKPTEIVPISIDWSHSLDGIKSVGAVTHVIGDAKGKPLVVAVSMLNLKSEGMENMKTTGILEMGVDGVDYRVTIRANLNTCEGSVINLEECVMVSVKGC